MHKKFHPPHIYLSDKIYFITCKTNKKIKYFNNNEKKKLLQNIIQEAKNKFKINLFAYVIIPNHYHLLLQSNSPINKIIQFINGKSAINLNKLEKTSGQKIWYQYWDRCIRSKKDFYIRLNYIHQNPIKHRVAKDLYNYEFSSIHSYRKKFGKEWINSCFCEYPIVDFTVFGE